MKTCSGCVHWSSRAPTVWKKAALVAEYHALRAQAEEIRLQRDKLQDSIREKIPGSDLPGYVAWNDSAWNHPKVQTLNKERWRLMSLSNQKMSEAHPPTNHGRCEVDPPVPTKVKVAGGIFSDEEEVLHLTPITEPIDSCARWSGDSIVTRVLKRLGLR